MKIGVECAHGFGDCVFSEPLIRAMSSHYGTKIGVAVRPHCKDAYYNNPYVNEIIEINGIGEGEQTLKSRGYSIFHQITPNIKFPEFKNNDPNHSLIDTHLYTGRQIGLSFDQKPKFYFTGNEYNKTETISNTVAIESVYKSGQSWADNVAFKKILVRHKGVSWLSNENAPPNVDNMLRFTRRELILSLRKCSLFFSVGSGFFCGMLALPAELQPKRTICLWMDEYYRYEQRLAELARSGWYNNITWVHNHKELDHVLESINC